MPTGDLSTWWRCRPRGGAPEAVRIEPYPQVFVDHAVYDPLAANGAEYAKSIFSRHL
ncbi:hypothetical protein [Streptomyces laurentii]|uniref:hypothetical protein n=1 Tax=Streptomyces laurentii TaxID=39478 RepID=UPI003409A1C7